MRNRSYLHPALFLLTVLASVSIFSCGKDHELDVKKYGNCSNKIQDQNETGVDCGGVCQPCPSCSDGIRNQDEEGVDCGGTCPDCAQGCLVTSSSVNYTLYPAAAVVYKTTASVYGMTYLKSSFTTEMSISISNSALVSMNIRFKDELDIFELIPLNSTMAFQTVASVTDVRNKNQVYIRYNYNYGFTSTNGSVKPGQGIYVTRIADKKARVRFCGLAGGSYVYGDDAFELDAQN